MSAAQDQAMADSVLLSKKEYEHMQDQLKECAFAISYLKKWIMKRKPDFQSDGYAYVIFDRADLSVVEQAEAKLKETP